LGHVRGWEYAEFRWESHQGGLGTTAGDVQSGSRAVRGSKGNFLCSWKKKGAGKKEKNVGHPGAVGVVGKKGASSGLLTWPERGYPRKVLGVPKGGMNLPQNVKRNEENKGDLAGRETPQQKETGNRGSSVVIVGGRRMHEIWQKRQQEENRTHG